jgi:hypothetical protein
MEIFEKTLRLIADIMTIFGLGRVLTWGLSQQNKTVWGHKLFLCAFYSVKFALIIIIAIISYGIFNLVYFFSLLYAKGNVFHYYWETGNEIWYILSYLIGILVAFPVFILSALSISTSSTYYIKLFLSKISSSSKIIPLFEILEASYGSITNKIDVTVELKSKIRNGRLAITASNNIAGDQCVLI